MFLGDLYSPFWSQIYTVVDYSIKCAVTSHRSILAKALKSSKDHFHRGSYAFPASKDDMRQTAASLFFPILRECFLMVLIRVWSIAWNRHLSSFLHIFHLNTFNRPHINMPHNCQVTTHGWYHGMLRTPVISIKASLLVARDASFG
jgi:hypothetical protein